MIRKEEIELAKDGYMRSIGAEPRADEDRNNLDVADAYIAGAKWADRTMIERACQWLQENLDDYLDVGVTFLVSDFKKAMQDESKDKENR